MRILTFADFHLGTKTHGKLDSQTGLNTREVQALKSLDELIGYAINNDIKVIIAAGDMYKNNLPTPTLQDEFNKRIKYAANNGILVLILDGNHDVGKTKNSKSAMASFETLDVDNVICTKYHKEIIKTIDNKTIKFVFLPTYHTREEIENIVNKTNTETHPTIFIGHLTVIGALLNDWLVEENETYIDVNVFNKKGVLAVVLGHLHKHQVVHRDPLVYYTGSTQRIDFNEEHQPKGFVVLDINDDNDVQYEFVELNTQSMYTIELDLSIIEKMDDETLDSTQFLIDKINENKENVKNSIVRVLLEIYDTTQINDKKIYNYLYDLGAINVLPIRKTYNYERRVRNKSLTEHVSITKALESYYNNYKDKKRVKERIKLGKQIINEIENL